MSVVKKMKSHLQDIFKLELIQITYQCPDYNKTLYTIQVLTHDISFP